MKTLSIDIETYSGTDLSKCGVYKYTEDPDFEVLLFGYAVDGGEVQVVDLALGESIPADVLDALTDDAVLKYAFNANFERVCLSSYLSDLGISLDPFHDSHPLSTECARFLNPAGWRCTMVWAAYMGLPLSLQGVGAVLNLDKQKLTEGKELIKYFCSPCAPTKSNGGRTRNRPEDAPEKWSLFKSYNLRDVETEMGIQQKLTKFPVSKFVWEEYHIDQEINDRGVRLDISLVDTAIRMDAASRQELMDDMRRITELENPNSVSQMRSWLVDNGLETDTLGKKAVNEMLKTAPPELADALILRQQIAKSSVKKYQAMRNAVCSDGRARGMFQFYGVRIPGIKFDPMLVLNGPQGIGKSTLIAKLAGEWFSDSLSLSDTKDKTAAEKLQGYWILEIGELAGLRKAETETLRSFISRQNDIYRAAFGKRATPHPRQCVFFGTTNAENGYLRDTTGNRRFWPVKTPGGGEKHSWQLTKEDIDQIWAETCFYVNSGEKLTLPTEVDTPFHTRLPISFTITKRETAQASFRKQKSPADLLCRGSRHFRIRVQEVIKSLAVKAFLIEWGAKKKNTYRIQIGVLLWKGNHILIEFPPVVSNQWVRLQTGTLGFKSRGTVSRRILTNKTCFALRDRTEVYHCKSHLFFES